MTITVPNAISLPSGRIVAARSYEPESFDADGNALLRLKNLGTEPGMRSSFGQPPTPALIKVFPSEYESASGAPARGGAGGEGR